jgi:hypothetical protein
MAPYSQYCALVKNSALQYVGNRVLFRTHSLYFISIQYAHSPISHSPLYNCYLRLGYAPFFMAVCVPTSTFHAIRNAHGSYWTFVYSVPSILYCWLLQSLFLSSVNPPCLIPAFDVHLLTKGYVPSILYCCVRSSNIQSMSHIWCSSTVSYMVHSLLLLCSSMHSLIISLSFAPIPMSHIWCVSDLLLSGSLGCSVSLICVWPQGGFPGQMIWLLMIPLALQESIKTPGPPAPLLVFYYQRCDI